jgi:L-ornithine Nalpha-acyltransferase
MTEPHSGRYLVREAETPSDLARVRALRALCFGNAHLHEADPFDTAARQFLIEPREGTEPVCSFRLTAFDASNLHRSYSAQSYDLAALDRFPGAMLELGRFCVHPDWHDPDILRLAWGRLAREVDALKAELLFGCSSFTGIAAETYRNAFALLNARHLAPEAWRPGVKAPEVVRFAALPPSDPRAGLQALPPLLRSYLAMGGWVSDHAVVDRAMNTLHVFTGLEIAAIPAGRKRLLRGLAAPKHAAGH